jgi:hypothetical protein
LTVTEYDPEALTVIVREVSPLDQRLKAVELEVRVTLPPWQKVSGPPAVMVGVVTGE